MLARMWRKGVTCALLVGLHVSAAPMENSMEIKKKLKLKMDIPYDPSIPLLCIYQKTHNKQTTTTTNSKRYMYSFVHCSILYNSQDTEATWVSIDRSIGKEVVVYVMEYYGAIKKIEIFPFETSWMN